MVKENRVSYSTVKLNQLLFAKKRLVFPFHERKRLFQRTKPSGNDHQMCFASFFFVCIVHTKSSAEIKQKKTSYYAETRRASRALGTKSRKTCLVLNGSHQQREEVFQSLRTAKKNSFRCRSDRFPGSFSSPRLAMAADWQAVYIFFYTCKFPTQALSGSREARLI